MSWLSSFADYLATGTVISRADAKRWLARMEILADKANMTKAFTRVDLKAAMTADEFDDLLEDTAVASPNTRTGGAAAGFHMVSIPDSPQYPIKPTGRRPLKRQMSDPDFRRTLPPAPEAHAKRRFFRTWVRVITKDMADELPRRLLAEANAEAERRRVQAEAAPEAQRLRQLQAATTGS